jgi:hypothetical protein
LEWGWLAFLKEGDAFKKSLGIYTFKELELVLQGQ